MSFLSNALSSLSGELAPQAPRPLPMPPTDGIQFAGSSCSSCADPCGSHPQLPEFLAKKIDQTQPLEGNMKPYQQHVLVRVGKGSRWAEHIEAAQDSFAGHVAAAMSARSLDFRVLLTAFESPAAADADDADVVPESTPRAQVVLFPQNVVLDNVGVEQLPALADFVAASHRALATADGAGADAVLGLLPPALGPASGVTARAWPHKATVFVCTHKRRDKRCGVAGPMLVSEFTAAARDLGMDADVGVFGISHIGGHKFAGCMIVYRFDSAGNMVGDWYGRVKSCHARPILQTTVGKDQVFRELWRGRMDTSRTTPANKMAW